MSQSLWGQFLYGVATRQHSQRLAEKPCLWRVFYVRNKWAVCVVAPEFSIYSARGRCRKNDVSMQISCDGTCSFGAFVWAIGEQNQNHHNVHAQDPHYSVLITQSIHPVIWGSGALRVRGFVPNWCSMVIKPLTEPTWKVANAGEQWFNLTRQGVEDWWTSSSWWLSG